MINNCSITLNSTIHVQVASEAGIGDLLILETLDSHLDRNRRIASALEAAHGHFGGTGEVSGLSSLNGIDDLLVAGLQMDLLVCCAVVTRAGMDEYSGNGLLPFRAPGHTSLGGTAHALYGNATSSVVCHPRVVGGQVVVVGNERRTVGSKISGGRRRGKEAMK